MSSSSCVILCKIFPYGGTGRDRIGPAALGFSDRLKHRLNLGMWTVIHTIKKLFTGAHLLHSLVELNEGGLSGIVSISLSWLQSAAQSRQHHLDLGQASGRMTRSISQHRCYFPLISPAQSPKSTKLTASLRSNLSREVAPSSTHQGSPVSLIRNHPSASWRSFRTQKSADDTKFTQLNSSWT